MPNVELNIGKCVSDGCGNSEVEFLLDEELVFANGADARHAAINLFAMLERINENSDDEYVAALTNGRNLRVIFSREINRETDAH